MRAAAEVLAPMVPGIARVVARRRETPDTVTLTLEVPEAVGAYEPGQFNMLYAFGVGEAPISVAGSDGERIRHAVRAVGAVSKALCSARPGDALGVRGPFGTGWDLDSAEGADLLVIGGGIGLAPLRGAVERILATRRRFGRVAIMIGARSPDLIPFRREIAAWRARFDADVQLTVDVADEGWRGNVGLVTDLITTARFEPADTVALVCGPEVMMRFVALALRDRGVGAERIRISMERNMKCAIGRCGHCQFGPLFVCTDGPVFTYDRIAPLLATREV